MEALTLLLCLLLTAYQANPIGSWTTDDRTTDDRLYSTEGSPGPCGGSMTDWMGDFFSPSYPSNYPDNARCTWTIHGAGATTVQLTFTDIFLETCCDYIRLFDGPSTLSPLLDEIREYKNKRYNSSNNDLTVLFYSDHSISRRGFHASWVFVDSNSCRHNCGYSFGNCSCDDSCQDNRNCCYDYDSYCSQTATWATTTDFPSCMYNCGYNLGSCSCTYNCQYYGNCCPDYDNYCSATTEWSNTLTTKWSTTSTTEWPRTEDEYSCENICGQSLPLCGCDDHCQLYGSCCPDYNRYCSTTTAETTETTAPSCMYNCGYNLGSCSCTYNCQYYGNCCPDYDNYCSATTEWSNTLTTKWSTTSTTEWPRTEDEYSCENICGQSLPLCGCDDHCQLYGSCCPDYNRYCSTTTAETTETTWIDTTAPSCMYNCGYNLGSCSCTYNCQYYGNCCPDYNSLCSTTGPATAYWLDTTESPSCMYNCGHNFSSCSCTHNCQYDGNCCPDFHWYCPSYTTQRDLTTVSQHCGGHLYGSGLFSSPNYPNYYHDNAYCVWYLSAQQGQRIFLSFADVQLERCCNCDYISVHDGSSTGHSQLGKVCFNDTTHQVFHSSSRYLTVVFRSDYSGVSHGFKAFFTSSLTADEGRVDCSSDNMVIVIQRSYLNSLGFSGNDLYVDDHLCRPSITSTEVVFSFSLDTCGTAKQMMNSYVSYTNNVRASQSQSGEITRQSQFLLHVGCRMEPDTMVQILYRARENINANITGTGHFNASIAFYTSSGFYQQIYDSPYEVNLNQLLYVQVKLNKPDNSLDLFLDTCVASPNPNDFKDRSYDLLRNGCPRDNTYYSYTSGQHYYAQFRFQAFKFLRTHSSVYLQCKVTICPGNDYNSRCRQGCHFRRKRSLQIDSTYHTNTVTLGPIKLKGRRHLFGQREKIEAEE
ncbi:deleted in malignant brain tumors 1 protein-like isoform X2 [Pimephales promelas]|uniref:deleted in malignant brain tumors 1 protein-like isoform X2 n=1 Tax=Pimephales promelas TaxID=90988 RepID=UPI001955B4CE|nr:deleted in malignant brain tumors 1 protein-like isoform X2 [Pimephales promelas]